MAVSDVPDDERRSVDGDNVLPHASVKCISHAYLRKPYGFYFGLVAQKTR